MKLSRRQSGSLLGDDSSPAYPAEGTPEGRLPAFDLVTRGAVRPERRPGYECGGPQQAPNAVQPLRLPDESEVAFDNVGRGRRLVRRLTLTSLTRAPIQLAQTCLPSKAQ